MTINHMNFGFIATTKKAIAINDITG